MRKNLNSIDCLLQAVEIEETADQESSLSKPDSIQKNKSPTNFLVSKKQGQTVIVKEKIVDGLKF